MPEKETQIISDLAAMVKPYLPFLTTILLSIWGGTVSHIQKLRKTSAKFKWQDYWFDIIICSFAGVLTHFFCKYASVDEWLSAILIAISGHMGTRTIYRFERMHSKILDDDGKDQKS
jgi:hypothetical protein